MQKVFEKIIEKLKSRKEKVLPKESYLFGTIGVAHAEGYNCGLIEAIEIVKQEAEQFGTDTNVGSKGNDVLEFANLLKELCCKKDEDYDNPVISPKYLNDTIENLLLDFNEQYNNGWIPCSERLPDECVPVNVTWINRNPESYYAKIKDVPFSATAVYYNSKWYWYSSTCVDYLSEYGKNDFDLVDKDIDIIAWQPLPKPFQPKGE